MRSMQLLSLVALVVCGLVGSIFLLRSCEDVGSELTNLPALLDDLQQVQARSMELDADHATLLSLDQAKNQLLREFIAGRLRLAEAADQYRELTLQQPHLPPPVCSEVFPGRPDHEFWPRMVVRDAQGLLLSDDIPDKQAVSCRLQEQLADFCTSKKTFVPEKAKP